MGKVITMEEKRPTTNNRVVTKANALIEASYVLTLAEQRVILACAAQLDGRRPLPKDNLFTISADEFVELFSLEPHTAYEQLRDAVDRLYERDIRKIDGKTRTRMRWVYLAEYKKGEGAVRLGFSPEIAPYLTLLHKKFTSYRLSEVSGLTSVYAIRLYEMLAQYMSTGFFTITVDDFRTRLQLEDKYTRFANLKARVLLRAVEELNAKTSLEVEWSEEKKGKAVHRLNFKFSERAQLGLFPMQ